jgi:hypothetical protein
MRLPEKGTLISTINLFRQPHGISKLMGKEKTYPQKSLLTLIYLIKTFVVDTFLLN